jgi:hypothetical protein
MLSIELKPSEDEKFHLVRKISARGNKSVSKEKLSISYHITPHTNQTHY